MRLAITAFVATTFLISAGCSTSKPTPDAIDTMKAEHRVPRFEREDVQSVRYRFYGERTDMLEKGEAFFPDTSGAKTCSLSGDAYEELLFGDTKAAWASSGSAITASKISVIDGDCQGNAIIGAGNVVVEYGYADTRNEGATQTAWLVGQFDQNGMVEGIVYRRSDDSFDPGRWTATYRTYPDFTLRFSFNTEELRTYLTEDVGDVERSTSYLGDELVRVQRMARGEEHGLQVVYENGTAVESCFVLGEEVARERCDGDGVELTETEQKALAEHLAEPAPTAARPAATTGSSGPWPDLAPLIQSIGGGEEDAAVIVGVEDYAFVSDVPGAAMNARDWYRYLTVGRGVPAANAKLLLNASATDDGIQAAARAMAANVGANGTLWIVFIGHGAPGKDQKTGLLVGVDAQQTARGLYGRSVSTDRLVTLAAAGAQKQTVMVVDACFSGRTAAGALAPGLQPMLSVDFELPGDDLLLLSAGTSEQFAGPLPKANRPAFSYLLLGALLGWGDANADGNVDAVEAIGYTRDTLSAVLTDRDQTPELSPRRAASLGASSGAAAPDVRRIVLGD